MFAFEQARIKHGEISFMNRSHRFHLSEQSLAKQK